MTTDFLEYCYTCDNKCFFAIYRSINVHLTFRKIQGC